MNKDYRIRDIIKKGYATGDIWCGIDDPDAKKIRDLADKIIRKYRYDKIN